MGPPNQRRIGNEEVTPQEPPEPSHARTVINRLSGGSGQHCDRRPDDDSARAADFEPPFLVPITARESGLPRDGWIKCDQPATLPTSVLGPRVGRLSAAAIERLAAAIRFVLGL